MTDQSFTDHKGYSEETCVRCGWRMGSPPLNCNNDDTPHRFPSQTQATGRPSSQELADRVREALPHIPDGAA